MPWAQRGRCNEQNQIKFAQYFTNLGAMLPTVLILQLGQEQVHI